MRASRLIISIFFIGLGENKIFKSGLLRANKIEASRCDARAAARLRSTAVCLHEGQNQSSSHHPGAVDNSSAAMRLLRWRRRRARTLARQGQGS